MKKMTLEDFNKIPAGDVISTGVQPNSPEGIFMTRDEGELRWVAKKGYGDDWAIYCHWSTHSVDWILQHGDKIVNKNHIQLCMPCEDEVFNKYRY